MEDYIKCELSGGESCRHLSTFSNLSLVAVHYHPHQHMLCIIATVDCTYVHHVDHYKISEHTISCCYC